MKIRVIPGLPLILIATAATAQQSTPMQFNVPYACPDGTTMVIHRCATGPKGEFCFFQLDQDSERYATRADVAARASQCKLKAAPAAAGSSTAPAGGDSLDNTRYDCGGSTVTVYQCQRAKGQDFCFTRLELDGKFLAQAPKPRSEILVKMKSCKALPQFSPPYLAEFPSAYRVVQGMSVGNPRDNVIRSIGAFYQLSEIINVLAGERGTRGYLPDEKKFLDDYSRIQSELTQAAAKKFSGEQFDVATNPFHYGRSDPRFGFEGIPVWVTFLSAGIQAQFARIVGGNDPNYQAKIEQEKQKAMQQLQADVRAAAAQARAVQAEANMPKDKGSVAMRRCMESGRSDMECLGEGLKIGAIDLAGGNPLKGMLPETPVGLRLTGWYAAGNFRLQFGQESVGVTCGTLIEQNLPYAVERTGSQLKVKIPTQPKPLILAYQTDGKLSGPGPADFAGQVVIGGRVDSTSTGYGMQTQTTTTQKQIGANEISNYNADQVHQNGMEYSVDSQMTTSTMVPTTVHHYSVPVAPKTERCNVAALPPRGETATVSGVLTQVLGTQAGKSTNTVPGLRLNGTYASPGGLKIEFRGDSATLECGEALNSEGYAIVPQGSQLVVRFDHRTGPFSLVLEPNGSLSGSGTVEVAGRKLVRSASNDPHNFVSRTARCTAGTLTATK